MHRIVIHRPGGYERLVLEQAPDPRPGPGELRIAVSHAGVNYADCVTRMGLYASAKKLVGWPITPGFEVAGVVDAIGADVAGWRIGDPVLGVTLFGGYASRIVLPATQVFAPPAQLRPEQAAALPAVFLTAWIALHELAHVRPGEQVLIHSAAGGVGSAAVQLARAAGAVVVAVVGSAAKLELPRRFGAAEVIDKSAGDLWSRAAARAPAGYDVILDPNGVATLRDSYRHLRPLGRLVVYGFHSMLPRSRPGQRFRLNWPRLAWDWLRTPRFDPMAMTMENRSVLAFNLSFLGTQPERLLGAMEAILDGVREGRLQAPPVAVYPAAEAGRAHRDLETGTTQGKLVLAF